MATNYDKLENAHLTTTALDDSEAFQDALNALNSKIVEEIIKAAKAIRGKGAEKTS